MNRIGYSLLKIKYNQVINNVNAKKSKMNIKKNIILNTNNYLIYKK